jgi:hypothetical protein
MKFHPKESKVDGLRRETTLSNTYKIATVILIAALFAPFLFAPAKAQEGGTILFDIYHGQYSSYVFDYEDAWLEGNLTALGYTVEWNNDTITAAALTDVDAFIIGSQYGDQNAFSAAEISAIGNWFNTGNKFLWVGYDSDYGGASYINDNMTAILAACGSHVYGEPTSVEDPYSNCESAYRVVANGTGDDAYVSDIVTGVDAILMHGPTCLYGSTSGDGANAVNLETDSIANVYPVLYYGASAVIVDADLISPLAHDDGDEGAFVAMTVEVYAGTPGTGLIMVSGASPYGDYKPMRAEGYYGVDLDGKALVEQAIDWAMETAPTLTAGLDIMLIAAIGGAVVVVIIIIVVIIKKK